MRATARCLFAALLAWTAAAQATDITPLLSNPKLWSLTQDEFQHLPETKGFRWTSAAHDSARAGEQELTLFALPLVEVVARFEGGKLVEITPTIYARGDVGGLPREQFEALIRAAMEALNLNTKVQSVVRGKDATNAVKAEGIIWNAPTAKYLLEYSFTHEMKTRNIPFRAEFVRLEIKPPDAKPSLLQFSSINGKAFYGLDHVKRDSASGDVVISDVPMVDQGQKGYCAVACAERMLRYYGVQTDANELAQIANTDAGRGTSADAMFDALKKVSARLHVRVKPVEQFEAKQMLSLIAEYNRTAKHDKAPEVRPKGEMLDVTAIFRSMDAGVLKETRTHNHSDVTRFQTDVAKYIDAGTPIIWSVMLGIFPEPGVPQSGGGHMRLIIGYNTKKNEIIFTDSWGAGHEKKRMPLENAVTISTGLTVIEPM